MPSFKENVVPNTMVFDSIKDKINYLIEHNYIETAFIKKYRPEFLEELSQFIKEQNFQFKSFMLPIIYQSIRLKD